MDQIKIGRFICEKRKEKKLTQQELANLINVKGKTISKWETGHGIPDVSIMIPLCRELDISINELLNGEKLQEKDYQKKAEENIIMLLRDKKINLKLYWVSIILMIVALVPSITLLIYSEQLEAPYNLVITARIMAAAIIVLALIPAVWLNIRAGYYECSFCGERFVPETKAYLIGPHGINTRYLCCPKCGKSGMFKKKFTKI